MMMPTSDSDGTFLPKVSGVLLLRMSLHWRLCAMTQVPFTVEDTTFPVAAPRFLLGRAPWLRRAEHCVVYYKTRKSSFQGFVVKFHHLRLESASSPSRGRF